MDGRRFEGSYESRLLCSLVFPFLIKICKVYLPTLQGHVPVEVICTFRAFLEFCYIVRRSALTEGDLNELQDALTRFHEHRQIFETAGVRPEGISLPRQHSLVHYAALIRLLGHQMDYAHQSPNPNT